MQLYGTHENGTYKVDCTDDGDPQITDLELCNRATLPTIKWNHGSPC